MSRSVMAGVFVFGCVQVGKVVLEQLLLLRKIGIVKPGIAEVLLHWERPSGGLQEAPKHELQAHGVVVEEHDPTHYEECVPPPVFWIGEMSSGIRAVGVRPQRDVR